MEAKALAITIAAIVALASAILVVRLKDLVYASVSLAVLGLSTAVIAALLGYGIVAAFLVIVYVGAAVMFIIVSMSMLGGEVHESWDHDRGSIAAGFAAAALAIAFLGGGLYSLYRPPGGASLSEIAGFILDEANGIAPAVFIVLAGLAATILEAIAVARRR